MRTLTYALSCSLLAISSHELTAADAVEVRYVERTYQVTTAEAGARRAKPGEGDRKPGNYAIRGTKQTNPETITTIELDNGLVTAVIAPAWGARLLRVTDNHTGVDYFEVRDEIQGFMPFQAGGVKASFPFFEHGMPLHHQAGHRVVSHDDGSVSVAMDLRFSHYTHPRHATRYGAFSDEILSVVVTLEPDSALVTWAQRKDNPNDLPRGDRFWNLACFPQALIGEEVEQQRRDGSTRMRFQSDRAAMQAETEFLFPANWVVDHGPTTVHTSPHWSALDNWEVSHFAIDVAAPFVGAWYPNEHISRLRIDQDGERIAAKLYTAYWATMVEQWGGIGDVFEHPGLLQPGHQPVQFEQAFWIAQNLSGPVTWADRQVALHIADDRVEVQAPQDGQAEVIDATGAIIASGPVGPHTALAGTGDTSRLIIRIDGETVLEQGFPLERPAPARDTTTPPAIMATFERLAGPNPYRIESESFGSNEGMPNALHAGTHIRKVTAEHDRTEALSLARAAYRIGMLAEAERVCGLFAGPEADLLLGLIAWERGTDHDFGSAGWQADWLRSLRACRAGDTSGALAAVDRYLAQVPNAWYPRLARSWWAQDTAAARTLAAENPASPEAQVVLELLGEAADYTSLIEGNQGATEHVARFRALITDGSWAPMPRFPLETNP